MGSHPAFILLRTRAASAGEAATIRTWLKIVLGLFALFILVGAGGGWWAWQEYEGRLEPVAAGTEETVLVTIPPGASTSSIATLLYDHNLIRDPLAFRLYARSQQLDQSLRAGEFLLSPGMDVATVLNTLVSGSVVTYPFTVPEGLTVVQVAELLAEQGLVDYDQFLALARDPTNLPAGVTPGPDVREPLEGYLFPDTYHIPRQYSEAEIITLMVQRFEQVMSPERQARAAELGLTVNEAITLASIIEREATSQDRTGVASVFHNRLAIDMKLDSCATINYVLDSPKLILTYADLETPSPYNTYLHTGLPPGPIANPGEAAIQAALYPDESDHFYFVVKADGGHAFAANYSDHERNRILFESTLSAGSQP